MTEKDAKLIDIAGQLKHETKAAWLMFDGAKDVWLPKSLVEYDDGIFTMPEWLAAEKGLI